MDKLNKMKNGWYEVRAKEDTRAYEQLLTEYTPDPLLSEYQFDPADPEDQVKLLWVQGRPAGFCTLKPEGVWIEELMVTYSMLTLDTIFVLPQYRRRGFVLTLLTDIMTHEDNLGVSSPVSHGMCAVLQKFLLAHPQYRSKLWEIQHGGGEGDRELIWYNLRRRRSLIHTVGA